MKDNNLPHWPINKSIVAGLLPKSGVCKAIHMVKKSMLFEAWCEINKPIDMRGKKPKWTKAKHWHHYLTLSAWFCDKFAHCLSLAKRKWVGDQDNLESVEEKTIFLMMSWWPSQIKSRYFLHAFPTLHYTSFKLSNIEVSVITWYSTSSCLLFLILHFPNY
mgnify:CR=1 FL=1